MARPLLTSIGAHRSAPNSPGSVVHVHELGLLQVHTNDSSTASDLDLSRQSFPFEKLAPELRNKIYRYLLSAPDKTLFEIGRDGELLTYGEAIRSRLHMDIMFVSKGIYLEAASFFYSEKVFYFDMCDGNRSMYEVRTFFSQLQPLSRASVRSLWLEIARHHIQSFAWAPVCLYLATQMCLKHLHIELKECDGPCRGDCPSEVSNLESPWAMVLSQIQGLESLTLHTVGCVREFDCGFGHDGIFDETKVPDVKESMGRRQIGMGNRRTREREEDPYVACDNECFGREFVEGMRAKMGLPTGERFVATLRGPHIGCYKDVVAGSVTVPVASEVVGLSCYCWPDEWLLRSRD